MDLMKPQNLRQRHSIRLKGYDYTQAGAYFITIVTDQRVCLFGDISNDQINLTPFGIVAQREWMHLPGRFQNLQFDAFVIMPNHLHGIMLLAEPGTVGDSIPEIASIHHRAPTQTGPSEAFGRPVPSSIPTMVRSYKAAVTVRINHLQNTTQKSVWQRNYYEHVIRNEDELNRAREYILQNPMRWSMDQENPEIMK
jgi:putative transposase